MTDSSNSTGKPTDPSHANGKDRRRHHQLRDLVDEMMASIRAATNQDLFAPEERADAEEQLARIMARVHAEALSVAERERQRLGASVPRAD
jgi:hypothetical protein